jgi:hypothetical protein
VLTEDGGPVPAATVTFTPGSPGGWANATTDGNGFYQMALDQPVTRPLSWAVDSCAQARPAVIKTLRTPSENPPRKRLIVSTSVNGTGKKASQREDSVRRSLRPS